MVRVQNSQGRCYILRPFVKAQKRLKRGADDSLALRGITPKNSMSISITWHAFSEHRADTIWDTFFQFRAPQNASAQEQYNSFLAYCAQWKQDDERSFKDYIVDQGNMSQEALEHVLLHFDLAFGALSVDIEDSKEDAEHAKALFVLFMPEISDDMLDRVDRIPTKDYITLSERIYPAI